MVIDFNRVMKYADHGFVKPREQDEIKRLSAELCSFVGAEDLVDAYDRGKINDVEMFDCFFSRTIDVPMMDREISHEDQLAAISYMISKNVKKRFG